MTDARKAALTRREPSAREAAEDELGAAIGRLLAISEAYPDLRADVNFRELQDELVATEQRLAFARDFTNHRVATYHELLETFPSVLVASLFRFERRQLFAVDRREARGAPDVDLDHGVSS